MTSKSGKTSQQINQQVLDNYKLVTYTVHTLWKKTSFRVNFLKHVGNIDDAISISTLVLYRAIELYDKNRASFSRYVVQAITKTLWKHCNREGIIRSPGYTKNHKGYQRNIDKVQKSRTLTSGPIINYLPSKVSVACQLPELNQAFKQLDETERKILDLRFGLCAGKPKEMSIAYISSIVKLPQKQVKAIITESLNKLKNKLE